MTPYWTSHDGRHVLYHGDCLKVLPTLAPGSVDAVVTDPPYSSGGQFRGDRSGKTSDKYVQGDAVNTCRTEFAGDNRDQRAYLLWSSLWLGECLQAARIGAVLCAFTDWRQLPVTTDAIQCGGWVWRNIVTWWKPGCRMQRGRFSSSAEYIVYASHGVPEDGEKSPQNVLMVAGLAGEDKDHIAQKPLPLMEQVLGVAVRGGTILDPFAGAGTTGVACIRTGRRFVGIEYMKSNCAIAVRRMEAELSRPMLIAPEVPKETQGELL